MSAHVHFHCATTVPPSRDLARQALLFLGRFVLSFFVPPILTVFYLIDLCDKEQKKERLRRRLVFTRITGTLYSKGHFGLT